MGIIRLLNQFKSKVSVRFLNDRWHFFASQADMASILASNPELASYIASNPALVHAITSDIDAGAAPAGTAKIWPYNVGSATGDWNPPINVWDSDPNTFADAIIDKNTKESTEYLLGTNNNAWVIGSTTITRVRLGVKIRFGPLDGGLCWVQPRFAGTTWGNEYSFAPTTVAETYWVDVTNDPAAPNPWLWTTPDPAWLDIKVFCEEFNGEFLGVEVYQLYIEVTYV